MEKVSPLRDFKYGEDRLIVADMAYREKSYIVLMQQKINQLAKALGVVTDKLSNYDKDFEKRVLKAEKEAADRITGASKGDVKKNESR